MKLQGDFFNCSSQISVPKWKTMGSQSETLFHEILDLQKILFGWTRFFFLALKFGRNSKKITLYFNKFRVTTLTNLCNNFDKSCANFNLVCKKLLSYWRTDWLNNANIGHGSYENIDRRERIHFIDNKSWFQ